METKRLVLLDAHAIIHRAYHATPNFSTSTGVPTGALYGLSAMLISIIRDLNPDYTVACFDLPKPTHRHEIFKEYKAGRKEADDDLSEQIQKSRDVFAAFGIPIYEHEGFEADDVLGAIVEQTKNKKDLEIVIASGDMDTLQLVAGERVRVYTFKIGIKDTIILDEQAVREKFGFAPTLIPDYKGLRGDPSDNIPGIKGIGDKTATILVSTFGSLDDLYDAIAKDEEKVLALVTPRILNLLKEGKDDAFFSKMLATIRVDAPVTFALPKSVWRDTIDVDEACALFDALEFRTLGERLKKLLGITAEDAAAPEQDASVQYTEQEIAEAEIALWLLRSETTSPSIDDVLQFTHEKDFAKAREALLAELEKRELTEIFETIEKPLIPIIARMNAVGVKIDTTFLQTLSKKYRALLDKNAKNIFKYAGGEFNINSPKQLGEVLFDTLKLGGTKIKKTATGQRSTRESELEKLRDEHPIIEEIFAYRELQKLLSTYIDNIPEMVGSDGRLHATFLQAGTTTGRLASRDPNVQNIPTKSELGRAVRGAFVAEKGYSLVAMDYSQIELRVAAILTGDEKLQAVFKQGGDIHEAVAMEVFGVESDGVTKEMRRKAKVINFGILYGMGVNALRANLREGGTDVSQKEAREFYDRYFASYPTLAAWVDQTKSDAARLGYTQTLFGRRRYFEGLDSNVPYIRSAAERMAINAPVQGTAADIIKLAMVRIDEYITKNKLHDRVRMVLQVHDELVFEIRDDALNTTAAIEQIMENVLSAEQNAHVPLLVDVSVGANWYDMRPR